MEEYYLTIHYDDCKLIQTDFGNPQVFEQGLYQLRKRGIDFQAFIIRKDENGVKLLPWG